MFRDVPTRLPHFINLVRWIEPGQINQIKLEFSEVFQSEAVLLKVTVQF